MFIWNNHLVEKVFEKYQKQNGFTWMCGLSVPQVAEKLDCH